LFLFADSVSTDFAAINRATRIAVQHSDVTKGRRVLQDHPTLRQDHRLDVWKSQNGLRLLGQKSSNDPNRRKVTASDLQHSLSAATAAAGAAGAAAAAGPAAAAGAAGEMSTPGRPLLLHRLTEIVGDGRPNLLELFASGALTLDRFDGRTEAELRDLLHPQVEEVVRSGWLTEDMLFRLHAAPEREYWNILLPDTRKTLLRRQLLGGNLPRMANAFLSLTDACLINLQRNVVSWVRAQCDTVVRLQPLRFSLSRWKQHVDAWTALNQVRDKLRRCDCPCTCAAGNINAFGFCKCNCQPGCKERRKQRFDAEHALRAHLFLFPFQARD